MNFKQKVKESFKAAKKEVSDMKEGMTDWILFLNESNRDLKVKVIMLEKKLNALEKRLFLKH